MCKRDNMLPFFHSFSTKLGKCANELHKHDNMYIIYVHVLSDNCLKWKILFLTLLLCTTTRIMAKIHQRDYWEFRIATHARAHWKLLFYMPNSFSHIIIIYIPVVDCFQYALYRLTQWCTHKHIDMLYTNTKLYLQ